MSRISDRPAAVRMRRLRERRRRGYRCSVIEISEADIDGLVAGCFLDRLRRHDPVAVDVAIGRLLDSIARPRRDHLR